jgi:hypothetical protein
MCRKDKGKFLIETSLMKKNKTRKNRKCGPGREKAIRSGNDRD